MKKSVSVVLALIVVLLTLCACGGAANTTANTSSALEGNWTCREIPESMQTFQSVTIAIQNGGFTYKLDDGKTTKISEGYYKITGDKSLVPSRYK